MKKRALILLPPIFLLLGLILLTGCQVRQNLPNAIEGEIDLTHWNL